ncbi:hypothetical protein EVAR_79850_1 [Eumeta japonica]|uniref:Uncharacterized protein n=1 Tax=Eumeta variegata TaxID=151549 RepID=A0A4C1TYU9_EUMVA|nr:hypothetical protein EVAR_79850_1 [Eumeta japonica]
MQPMKEQNSVRFNCSNSGDLTMVDHSRSGRRPVWEIEATKKVVEDQPSAGTRRISDFLGTSKAYVGNHRPAYALEKLYFFGIIKNEPKLDGVASFNYGVPMATFQLHHQTLITIEYQSTRQDESNEPKLDGVASFNYGVPMATFQLHHQTLVTI